MPLRDGYELHPAAPSIDEYLALRRIAGLSVKTAAQAQVRLRRG